MPSSKSGSRLLDRAGHAYVRALGRLVESSRRHAWWVLTGALALTVASGYFAVTHLAINTDTSQVLFHNLPFTKIDRQLEQAFPRLRDRILVIVDGDTAGLAASAARRLAQRLRTDTQSLGAVYEPGGGEFFRRNGLLYLTPQQLRQLTDRLVQAEPMVATLARDPSLRGLFGLLDRALAPGSGHRAATPALEPLLSQLNRTVRAYNAGRFYQLPWAQLMGAANGLQGTRRLIMVTPKQGPDSRAAGAAAINAVRGAIADLHLNQAGGTRVALTGSVVLSQEQLKSVTTGASLSLALSLVLVVVFLAIGLRSLRMILATLSVLLMGLIWTTAFAVGAVGPFNLISISFAVLFVGLGVDFGIQFCTRYYEELRPANQPRAALTRTVVGMGPPLSLAAVAAACSFYSVVPTDYAGIVDLGIIAGTSMFIALFANLTVLPALLVILRVRRKGGALREPFQFGFLPVRRHARGIVIGAAAIGIIAVPLIFQARFDFNLTKLQNPKAPAVVAFRELERGPYSPLPVEALAPDLDRAEQLADRARKLEPVSRAVTLQSYVPADQDRKLAILQETGLLVPPSALQPASTEAAPGPGELEAALEGFTATAARAARAPPAPGLAPVLKELAGALRQFHDAHGRDPAALQALQQRVIGTLPAELSHLAVGLQARRVTLEALPASLRNQYIAPDGRARIEVFSRHPLDNSTRLVNFVSAVHQVIPDAAGTPVLFVEGGRTVVSAFREASVLSVVLIAALLGLTLRRTMDVLQIMAPLLMSGIVTVAAMVFLGIDFNLANIIVLPLLIGLGVAFAIYVVLRWRSGLDIEAIMHSSTPGGVLFSALTTLSSFGSLAIAPDPGMAVLGRTLAVALAVVLVSVMLVLPASLALVPQPGPRRGPPPTE